MATASSRGRPTAEVAREKAAAIITAATEAFCELGYRAVTMRHIATMAQVSTRTLYNQYSDKFSLFEACLELGSSGFPTLSDDAHADVATVLHQFAVALVRMLSGQTSQRLGMLVYREGTEFPELVKASERNQRIYVVEPLSTFLLKNDLADHDADATAKILVSMILSAWQRQMSFWLPSQSDKELEEHASRAIRLFLKGAARGIAN